MVIVGLTGSIGMGKSTAAAMLRRLGVAVHDSDAVVHRLTRPGGAAVAAIAREFPGTVTGQTLDRRALGALVFGDRAALRRLEAILHPLVRRAESRFLREAARRRRPVVALDIPLLFETGGGGRVDAVIVVSAPGMVQTARVMARPGMTSEKLAGILARQLSDREKRRRADFVVPTGAGRRLTLQRLRRIVGSLRLMRGHHWPRRGYTAR
ncbi:MAG: dephospho-CoA kinase [Azospirillum sp.]|nr:dephospho-CoA kinase [Azospirillum sp.]